MTNLDTIPTLTPEAEIPKDLSYRLYLRSENGKVTHLASATGSPFWTEIYLLAKAMYGEDNIDYTFGTLDAPKFNKADSE